MKKVFSILGFALLLFSILSCNNNLSKLKGTDGNINHFIYPYLKFTLSDDKTYFIATVIDGAKLESVSVPGALNTAYGTMPISEFGGFENPNDSNNLKSLYLDINIKKIKNGALENAKKLEKIETIGSLNGAKWADLGKPNKPGFHFIGWKAGDTFIQVGALIDPQNSIARPIFEPHEYVQMQGKAPTCIESGYDDYLICSKCDYSSYKEIPPLGHSIVHVAKINPTCSAPGIREHYECTRCGLYFSDKDGKLQISDIFIPMLKHELKYKPYVEPTCQNEGRVEHWWCERCEKNFNDENGSFEITNIILNKVNHISLTPYEKNSTHHWKRCKWCSVEFDKGEHLFDNGIIIESAENHKKGKKKFTCLLCGFEKFVDIPEHDHIPGKIERKEATCLEDGYEKVTCKRPECGEVIITVIPALEHEGYDVALKNPTCTESGNIAHFHCNLCGFNFESKSSKFIIPSVIIDKVPHEAGIIYFSGENSHWNLCIYGCGTRMNISHHIYDREVVAPEYKRSDSDCKYPAFYYKSCICGKAGSDYFASGLALGHNIEKYQQYLAPTCEEVGYNQYWYCSRCKLYFTDQYFINHLPLEELIIPKLDHNYVWVTNDINAHYKMCTRCMQECPGSRGQHTYIEQDGNTICSVCGAVVLNGEGGFKPIIIDKRPLAHLSYIQNGEIFTFELINDKEQYPPTSIEWYLNDKKQNEVSNKFEFSAPYPMTYKVMCVYSNEGGKGSQTIVVVGKGN